MVKFRPVGTSRNHPRTILIHALKNQAVVSRRVDSAVEIGEDRELERQSTDKRDQWTHSDEELGVCDTGGLVDLVGEDSADTRGDELAYSVVFVDILGEVIEESGPVTHHQFMQYR